MEQLNLGNFSPDKIKSGNESEPYTTFLYSSENWESLKDQIIPLVQKCFPEYKFTENFLKSLFTKTIGVKNGNGMGVFLEDGVSKKLVGFTTATVQAFSGDPSHLNANIDMTGIDPERRGQGLTWKIIEALEEELRSKGVKSVTRQSTLNDGYADAIERRYGDRVLEKEDDLRDTAHPKRNFKIKL